MKSYGYNANLYTYLYFANNYMNEKTREYISWISQFNKICTYTGKYNMWQYTSNGYVKGINTNVDLNILF